MKINSNSKPFFIRKTLFLKVTEIKAVNFEVNIKFDPNPGFMLKFTILFILVRTFDQKLFVSTPRLSNFAVV